MGISINDLSPKAREQAMIKVAIEEARRRNKTAEIPGSAPKEKKEPKQNKYRAQKVDGCLKDGTPHTFDSVKEFDRYQELVLLERAGQISDLETQVRFVLIPTQREPDIVGPRGGKKPGKLLEQECVYIADFVYYDLSGEKVVEDVKGYRDPSSAAYAKFTIKRKLMLWIHGIRIREV